MVYVFGGGLCGGFAGNRYFNGSELAIHHNVIVVTVSYRLGALGCGNFGIIFGPASHVSALCRPARAV